MTQLTSLLICLMSAGSIALQNARSSMPEAQPGPRPWEQRYGVAGPRSFHPPPLDSIRGPKKPSSVINPKSLSFEVQGPPSNTQDSGSSKYPDKYPFVSSKPAWHFKFSVPFFTTTTAAPKTQNSQINVNAGFSYSESSQDKVVPNPHKMPWAQKSDDQKPSELAQKISQPFETFFSKLIPGGSSSQSNQKPIIQKQQDKVVINLPQQLSHHHKSDHYQHSSGQDGYGSTQTSDDQKPAQQSVYRPKWFQLHKQETHDKYLKKDVLGHVQLHKHETYDKYLKKDVLEHVQYVNGQYMIPVEKCPGFEKFTEYLKGHYQQHGQFPYGYNHKLPPHHKVYQHGQSTQGHYHQPWQPTHSYYPTQSPMTSSPPPLTTTNAPPMVKPNYASFFLHVGGPAPNPSKPSEETNVHVHGGYQEYPIKWQSTYPGEQKHLKPGQTYTYMQAPDKQQAPERSHHLSYENRSPTLLRPAWN